MSNYKIKFTHLIFLIISLTTHCQLAETQEAFNSDGLRLRKAAPRIKCLKELNDPGNGYIVRDQSKKSYNIGDFVAFTCKTGYRLIGEQLLNCMSNGEWNHPQPTCERRKCLRRLYDPGNGFIASERFKIFYDFGDVVQFTCKPGYRLNGEQFLNCLSNGEWDHPQPTCEREGCLKKFNDPGNGFIVSDRSKRFYNYGDVVEFACKRGYRLRGEQFLNCMSNGEWDHVQPTCEIKSCNRPDKLLAIPHSHIKHLTTTFAYRQTLNVECDQWYEQTAGTATWVCNDDEQWIESGTSIGPSPGNLPKCRPKCGQRAVRESFFASQLAGARPVKNRGAWPWMVLLDLGRGLNGDRFCAGSLIDEKTVVTVANCIDELDHDDELIAWMGMNNRSRVDNYTKSFKVVEMHKPNNFTLNTDIVTFDSDIAVLKLNQPVDLSLYIRPICLPISPEEKQLPTTFLREQKKAVLTGWGKTESGKLSTILRKVRLPIIPNDVCGKSYMEMYNINGMITHNMFCAGKIGLRSRDSCDGDSGSPLMFDLRNKYYLNGIVSFGDGRNECGKAETYGGYTNVGNFVNWIAQFTEK